MVKSNLMTLANSARSYAKWAQNALGHVSLFDPPEPERRYFIVDGEVYDFKDFIPKHPGGSRWFSRANGRDITPAIYGYHADPDGRVKHMLNKYKVAKEDLSKDIQEEIHPKLNVPPFILPPEFDATKGHVITFDFHKKGGFMERLRKRLLQPEMRTKIKKADRLFDMVTLAIFLLHLYLWFPYLYYRTFWIPSSLLVVLMAALRTSMAAAGHYHCHRAKNGITDWADPLFDIQYVGAFIVTYDGHVMLHHFYTNSPADVKRTVFTGMLMIPRLWRIPVYSIHKFGHFFSGMFVRWYLFHQEPELNGSHFPLIKHIQFIAVRSLMILEMFWAFYCGAGLIWCAQFFLTIWWNLMLIVSSHDFEESESHADLSPGQDWGVFQVKNSFDMCITGNKYVDIFLTAGLGTHRVHHVLPYQGSGFANIISQPAVEEVCKEMDVPWERTKNFVTERIQDIFSYYMLAPAQLPGLQRRIYGGSGLSGFIKEHLASEGFVAMYELITTGFSGQGSI